MGQVTVMAQSSSCEPDCWDVFLFPAVEPGEAPKTWDVSARRVRDEAALPRPGARATTDPERPPEIAHGFLIDPADALPIVEGAYLMRRIAESEHVRPYVARELRPGAAGAPRPLRASTRRGGSSTRSGRARSARSATATAACTASTT